MYSRKSRIIRPRKKRKLIKSDYAIQRFHEKQETLIKIPSIVYDMDNINIHILYTDSDEVLLLVHKLILLYNLFKNIKDNIQSDNRITISKRCMIWMNNTKLKFDTLINLIFMDVNNKKILDIEKFQKEFDNLNHIIKKETLRPSCIITSEDTSECI